MRSLLFLFVCFFALIVASPAPSEPSSSDVAMLDSDFDVSDIDDDFMIYDIEEPFDVEAQDETFDVEAEAEAETEAENEFQIEQAPETGAFRPESLLATLAPPAKRRLATRLVTLPPQKESVRYTAAPETPRLSALPTRTLSRQMMAKRHAPRLSLQRLPIKATAVTERRKVQTLAPLPPRQRAPQYRQQKIHQEVIQPVVSIQPMLHQRMLTRTVIQPTMQKQPVIQRIITQPILTRTIRQQPITQQQMAYQNIVQTREVKEPQVREELKVEAQTEKQQTVEAAGAPFPRLTAPPKSH